MERSGGVHESRVGNVLLGLAVYAGMTVSTAKAQAPAGPPPVPDGPRYVVAYLEVMPTATTGALGLVRRFRDATRRRPATCVRRRCSASASAPVRAPRDVAGPGCADTHGKAPRDGPVPGQDQGDGKAPIDERVHFPSRSHPPAKSSGAAVAA